MNIFMQGMRRSGTTILYDILSQDPGIDCLYEPLAKARPGIKGGGSRMQKSDHFEKIRKHREDFSKQYGLADTSLLNHGAPRDPALEYGPDLPEHVSRYIAYMGGLSEISAFKFTRAYCKVAALHEIDPQAKFVHIVRDPRSVAASFIFGKEKKHFRKFSDKDVFFSDSFEMPVKAIRGLFRCLLELPEYSSHKGATAIEQILLLWKYQFNKTHTDGKACFGENYHVFRHEDLLAEPAQKVDALYGFMGLALPDSVRAWVMENVRGRPGFHLPDDPRWGEAISKLGLGSEMRTCGYTT